MVYQYTNQEMSSIRDFIPLCKIGQGAYSTVYKVQRRSDGQTYALKKVKMTQLSTKEQENALNEIRILASIENQAIVAYKQAFFDQNIHVLCIVMEYADGGDLHHLVNTLKNNRATFPQVQIWTAIKTILMGLQILHQRTIMHRDLKSANVFKTAKGYKLGDLNVSKVVAGSLAYTQTGTPYYASPQVWRDEPYDARSDIWSLGVIVFEMAALCPPFEGKDLDQLYKNVQSKPVPPISREYSVDLSNLINYCLNKKACKRPLASQLLKHPPFQPYFNKGTSQELYKQNSSQSMKKTLLQTIKLPADLAKLKGKLPDSRYQSRQNINQSSLCAERGNTNQIPSAVKVASINKSQIFRSPPSKRTEKELIKLGRVALSESPINPRLSEVVAKYSDRVLLSDKKSNKVERASSHKKYEQAYLNVEKYISNRRPNSQSSIPRTQKVAPKVPQPLREYSSPVQVEEIRRRLIKKCRVFSSNQPKPSWWG